MSGRETTAIIAGRTYQIPDIWLAGFCQANQCTVQVAALWWHGQEMLAESHEAQTGEPQ